MAFTIAAVLFAVASAAVAATSEYTGTVKSNGALQLFVKRSHGSRKVVRFDFQRVGIKCNGHHRSASGNLKTSYRPKVVDGAFKVRADNGGGGFVRVNGELRRHGRAKGTIRLDGTFKLDESNQVTKHCHSGVKDWTAKRG